MAYEILSQEPRFEKTLYTVVLKADDGYSETQQYIGDEDTLKAADAHFNSERLAWVAKMQKTTPPADNAAV